jgi:hypothetical protein
MQNSRKATGIYRSDITYRVVGRVWKSPGYLIEPQTIPFRRHLQQRSEITDETQAALQFHVIKSRERACLELVGEMLTFIFDLSPCDQERFHRAAPTNFLFVEMIAVTNGLIVAAIVEHLPF